MKLARRSFLTTMLAASAAPALGRTPYGGSLELSLPLHLDRLDPHAIDDAAAAVFARSISDTLYALDSASRPYAALARALPERLEYGVRFALRPKLKTGYGRTITASDVVWSLARARQHGAAGLLGEFGKPKVDPTDPLAVVLTGMLDPDAVAAILANPLTAVLPRKFSERAPDGTGAFRARIEAEMLVLERNPFAARGPAFLDRVRVRRARDLADALRAFEAGDVDVGWLGRGLHRPRPDAVSFEAGLLGWIVLRTGRDLGSWGAPGVAEQLLGSIPAARLLHLGLRGLPSGTGSPSWNGPGTRLLVPNDFPHLIQIGRTLSGLLSRPGHELSLVPIGRQEFAAAKRSGRFPMLLDFVRPVAGPASPRLSLLTAIDPTMAERPPRESMSDARAAARTLPVGIVGELHLFGAHAPDLRRIGEWSLSDAFRERKK